MKNVLGFFALLILLAACNNTREDQESFRHLSSDWDKTYALVNDFVDQVETSQINWQEQFDRMELSSEEMNGFDEGTLAVLTEIKTTCREHGHAYDIIAEEVEAFAIQWEAHTARLDEIETMLDEGEKVENLEEEMLNLQKVLDEVPGSIDNWSKRLESTFTECQQNCQHFERLASKEAE